MDKSTKKLQIGLWSIVAALVVGLCCMWYYQAHHFNKNVTINGISVGKMTAKDAADHLKNVTLDNTVYVGNDVMYRGQKTSAGFSSKDDGKIEAGRFDQGKLEKKSRDRRICRHEGRQGFGRSGRKRNAVRRAENHEGV